MKPAYSLSVTDNIVYGVAGTNYQRFSNETIEKDIENSETDKARALHLHRARPPVLLVDADDGSTKKNWTLDTTTGFWHERSETDILCKPTS